MAQSQESSGLLSLAALREHEKRHAHRQAEAARVQAEAEQRARSEAERANVRADQERRRAELAAQELVSSSQLAEEARQEAARGVELERAQGLAQSCERLRAELAVERAALRASELGSASKFLRQRLLTTLTGAVCVGSWLAGAALYLGVLRPSSERALLGVEQAATAERRARSEAEAHIVRAGRERDGLAQRVDTLEQQLREARATSPTPAVPVGPAHAGGVRQLPPHHLASAVCTDDGDPLNPCLKH